MLQRTMTFPLQLKKSGLLTPEEDIAIEFYNSEPSTPHYVRSSSTVPEIFSQVFLDKVLVEGLGVRETLIEIQKELLEKDKSGQCRWEAEIKQEWDRVRG